MQRALPSPPDSPTPPLEYAPPLSWHRRRRVRRVVVVCFSALLLLGFVFKFGPDLWRRTTILYWQRQCLRYVPPDGRVVYHRRRTDRSPPPYANVISTKSAGFVPPQWSKFYAAFSPPGFISSGTAFLGKMKRPDGEERLVAVDLGDTTWPDSVEFYPRVLRPGTYRSDPAQVNLGNPINGAWSGMGGLDEKPFEITAGTVDPANPSHLSFQTHREGDPRTVDGWLRNDDTLLLEVRRIPARFP